MKLLTFLRALMLTLFVFLFSSIAVNAQTTFFTYQGRLNENASAANGTYDLQFTLFDGSGTLVGTAQVKEDVSVTNGGFTTTLDFGVAAFDGSARLLEIGVREGNSTGAFTPLTPRQAITSTPYAIRALNAGIADTAMTATTATNAQQLGGTAASQYTKNDSQVFIRNQTTQQVTSNFNIGGTGAANIFNATTQYNIGGSRILSNAGNDNLIAGVGAGSSNTGNANSFFGARAGRDNTTGGANSFFGTGAGVFNNTGASNSFFGYIAGAANTTGFGNAFFGIAAGQSNITGAQNSFFGANAGSSGTTSEGNAFVGALSGFYNTMGNYNSFFGRGAGSTNTTGDNNTIIGHFANVGSDALTFATALGAGATVNASNTIAFGRSDASDKVLAYGLLQVDTLGVAGSTSLCRNANNEISTCTAANLAEESSETKTEVNLLREKVKRQELVIAELKLVVCSIKADAAVCKK